MFFLVGAASTAWDYLASLQSLSSTLSQATGSAGPSAPRSDAFATDPSSVGSAMSPAANANGSGQNWWPMSSDTMNALMALHRIRGTPWSHFSP